MELTSPTLPAMLKLPNPLLSYFLLKILKLVLVFYTKLCLIYISRPSQLKTLNT